MLWTSPLPKVLVPITVALSRSWSAPVTISDDEAEPESTITMIGIRVSIGSEVVLYCVSVPAAWPFDETTSEPFGTKRDTMPTASLIRPPPLPLRSRTNFFIPWPLSFRKALRNSPETFSVKPLW